MDRPAFNGLTEDEIERIAERAADKAVEKVMSHVYAGIGKSVVQKALILIGAFLVAALVWIKTGHFPSGK
jgi:tetrahydromethanopterin S-methyltransferase subunit G